MPEGTTPTQTILSQALEDMHTRLAAAVLGLDPAALEWRPSPLMSSTHDLIVHAAAEERRWIGEGVASIPAADESRFTMLALSSGLQPDHALFELGSVGQVSQIILLNLAAGDWSAQRQVGEQVTTVADCVLRAVLELARVLGHIESIAQLWQARTPLPE